MHDLPPAPGTDGTASASPAGGAARPRRGTECSRSAASSSRSKLTGKHGPAYNMRITNGKVVRHSWDEYQLLLHTFTHITLASLNMFPLP